MKNQVTRTAEEEIGINSSKPTLKVVHRHLKRTSSSHYDSECPMCFNGILRIEVDHAHRRVSHVRCTCCGQRVQFLDIQDLQIFEEHRASPS